MRHLTLILAVSCLLPTAADAAVGGSAKASFRLAIPRVGSVTVAQVKLTAKKKPKLTVSNKPELRGTVTVVAAVVKSGKSWTARIVIANRGAKSASGVDEDLGFVAFNATVPGLGNRGVTGAAPVTFLNVTPLGSHSAPPALCTNLNGSLVAGTTFGDYSPDQIFDLADDALCGHEVKGGSAFFGVLRGTSGGPFSFNAVDVATGDFNGDGTADIGAVDSAGTFTMFVGLGDGTFGLPLNLFTTSPPVSVKSADIDLDGLNDVAVSDVNSIDVFSGSFLGAGAPRAVVTEQSNILGVTVGRFNGDAFGDLAVATSGGIDVFFGTSSGPFQAGPHLLLPGGDKPVDVLSGDFNNDGTDDIVALGTDGFGDFALSVSTDKGGTFSTPVDEQFFTADPSVFTFGRQTMVFSSSPPAVGVTASGGVRLFTIFPGGTLGPQQIYPVGEGASGAIVGDVNGDKLNDLLVLNKGSGSVSTFNGTSSGFTKTPQTSLVGANPVSLSLLDFDGKADLVVANGAAVGGTRSVTVLKGTGSGTFTR